MSGPDLGSTELYKERLQFRDRIFKRYLKMSKLVLTLIASLFAVSAFAADAAKVEVKAAPIVLPVAAPATVTPAAPVAKTTPAKQATKVKHHKSHAAKAVKPAAKASAPVAAAK